MSYTFSFTDTSNTQCASSPEKQHSFRTSCAVSSAFHYLSFHLHHRRLPSVFPHSSTDSTPHMFMYISGIYVIIFALYQRYHISCKICLFLSSPVLLDDLVFLVFAGQEPCSVPCAASRCLPASVCNPYSHSVCLLRIAKICITA